MSEAPKGRQHYRPFGARFTSATSPQGSRPGLRAFAPPVLNAKRTRYVSMPKVLPPSGTAGTCTPISRLQVGRRPVGPRTQIDRSGSRTHTSQALNLRALPVGLPGLWTVADLGVEPSHQAYETRSSAGPSAISGDGGIRTHTQRLLRPPPHTNWATSPSLKCGIRSAELGPV